jgi:hypothetical protein
MDGGTLLRLTDGAGVSLAAAYRHTVQATLAIRPDNIRLGAPGAPAARATGEVELCTYLGSVVEHVVRIGPDATILTRGTGMGPNAAPRLPAGSKVALIWAAEAEHLFDHEDRAVSADPAVAAVQRETNHV